MVRSLGLSIAFGLNALAASACDGGSPARPTLEPPADATMVPSGAPDGGAITDAAEDYTVSPHYAVCPDAMAPTFPSILAQMFATASCGVASQFDCHSTTGALPKREGGTGSLLDFSLDAAAVYAELLGDGGGSPSINVDGDAGVVLRVAPGQADASLLYIKLALPTATDPRYGTAMPPNELPCPSVLDTVRVWIEDGAAPK
jgi:hypothetical protein